MVAKIKQNKKGLTPIISVILLLMMAVSTAAGMFYWLARVQGQQQGSIESFQSGLFDNLASAVDIVDADYNTSIGHLDLFLQNTGNSKVPLDNTTTTPTTAWVLFDANQRAICSTDWSGTGGAPLCVQGCGSASVLEIGQIRHIEMNLSGSNCGVGGQPGGAVMSFLIDFSGVTTTAGSFIR